MTERFARLPEMEPGMWFRTRAESRALKFLRVEKVRSRFAGKRRVRVITAQGVSWVADYSEWYPLVMEGRG